MSTHRLVFSSSRQFASFILCHVLQLECPRQIGLFNEASSLQQACFVVDSTSPEGLCAYVIRQLLMTSTKELLDESQKLSLLCEDSLKYHNSRGLEVSDTVSGEEIYIHGASTLNSGIGRHLEVK